MIGSFYFYNDPTVENTGQIKKYLHYFEKSLLKWTEIS